MAAKKQDISALFDKMTAEDATSKKDKDAVIAFDPKQDAIQQLTYAANVLRRRIVYAGTTDVYPFESIRSKFRFDSNGDFLWSLPVGIQRAKINGKVWQRVSAALLNEFGGNSKHEKAAVVLDNAIALVKDDRWAREIAEANVLREEGSKKATSTKRENKERREILKETAKLQLKKSSAKRKKVLVS